MKPLLCSFSLALTLAACAIGPGVRTGDEVQEPRARMAEPAQGMATEVDRILERWPEAQRKAAYRLIERYGRADEVTESHMVWRRNGPWHMTLLLREGIEHAWPSPHEDYLQQFVKLRVPVDKYDDIAAFDGSVQLDRTAGLASARCGGEAMNYLALNLAYEIAEGKRTTREARQFYAEVAASDETSPYTERLLFRQSEQSADADRPHTTRSAR